MAVRTRAVSVGTTATPLNNLDPSGDNVSGSAGLGYNDGAQTVYVGGADVSTSGATKGVPLLPGGKVVIEGQGDILYGIVVATTCNVTVLEVGVAAA